jgi:hypothetical protein
MDEPDLPERGQMKNKNPVSETSRE